MGMTFKNSLITFPGTNVQFSRNPTTKIMNLISSKNMFKLSVQTMVLLLVYSPVVVASGTTLGSDLLRNRETKFLRNV